MSFYQPPNQNSTMVSGMQDPQQAKKPSWGDPLPGWTYNASDKSYVGKNGQKLTQGPDPYFGAGPAQPLTPQQPTNVRGNPTPNFPGYNPSQPYTSYNNGSYKPTTAPFGFDQTQPGQQEQFWNNNQNLWMNTPQLDWVNKQLPQMQSPTQAEQFASQNLGAFGQPGAGQQFWNQVAGNFNQQMTNQGNLQPQFDKYYDLAEKKAVGDANAQAAARGAYGSSAALNNVGDVIAQNAANRAQANTNFALQNAQNMNSTLGAYGNLALGAGLQGIQQGSAGAQAAGTLQNMGLNRFQTGVDTAAGLNNSYLSRLNSAYGAAGNAQQDQMGRSQNAYNNNLNYLGTTLPFLEQGYGNLLTSDTGLMNQAMGAGSAQAQQGVNNQQNLTNQIGGDIQQGVGLYTGLAGMGMANANMPSSYQQPPPLYTNSTYYNQAFGNQNNDNNQTYPGYTGYY